MIVWKFRLVPDFVRFSVSVIIIFQIESSYKSYISSRNSAYYFLIYQIHSLLSEKCERVVLFVFSSKKFVGVVCLNEFFDVLPLRTFDRRAKPRKSLADSTLCGYIGKFTALKIT